MQHRGQQGREGARATATAKAEVLTLLLRYGANSTSFQVLEEGFSYWFADSDACVAYVRVGRCRVVAGAPIASPERLGEVAQAFLQHCARDHRRAVFFGVERRFLRQIPLAAFLVGEQPIWDPRRWAASSLAHRSLRGQVARAARQGVQVRLVAAAEWQQADGATATAVRALIARWHASKALAPMGFLVQVRPFAFAAERRFWVAERQRQVVGFLAIVPVYARQGWLLEDLLRDPAAPNGTAELLVDAAMRYAAAQGCAYVTMGLAPLSGAISPVLRSVGRLGAGLYDFGGLHAFKAKLQPHAWEPIYVAHPAALPRWRALLDVLRAFAPQGLVRFGLDTLLRGPSVVLTTLWVMLIPWTLGLAVLDGPRWFGSAACKWAWVTFDVGCAAALASLTRRWRPRLATALAWLISGDACLTCLQLAWVQTPSGPWAMLAKLMAALAPSLAALILWRARRRHALWRTTWGERRDSNPRPPGPQPGALPTELRSPRRQG